MPVLPVRKHECSDGGCLAGGHRVESRPYVRCLQEHPADQAQLAGRYRHGPAGPVVAAPQLSRRRESVGWSGRSSPRFSKGIRTSTKSSCSTARPWPRHGAIPAHSRQLMDLIARLRRGRFDAVLDLQGLFRTASLAWLSGCKTAFRPDLASGVGAPVLHDEDSAPAGMGARHRLLSQADRGDGRQRSARGVRAAGETRRGRIRRETCCRSTRSTATATP